MTAACCVQATAVMLFPASEYSLIRSRRAGTTFSPASGGEGTWRVKRLDRFLQAVALDEPHRVVRPAVVVLAEPVHGHDAGMLQASGNFSFQHKTSPAVVMVSVVFLQLFERDFAVQLRVECDRDLAESAAGMGPQNAEARCRGRGG